MPPATKKALCAQYTSSGLENNERSEMAGYATNRTAARSEFLIYFGLTWGGFLCFLASAVVLSPTVRIWSVRRWQFPVKTAFIQMTPQVHPILFVHESPTQHFRGQSQFRRLSTNYRK
ncbi:hypothetical protein Zmor_019260 [Zophobas morio]|uniref:Uncharacterized protein n=1 Tax=Zophobas morio TaxID=2755281 RepID=A0AA38I389_9CUCU|nr:hypothetical protein Zmor_019260 [Zophobas morio]